MEEDKKIIKGFINFWRTQDVAPVVCEPNIRAMENVLNELERLKKENEELKLDNSHQWEERCKLTFELDELKDKYIFEKVAKEEVEELLENSITKQAIRDKIEELENQLKKATAYGLIKFIEGKISILTWLLGEEE